VANQKLLRAGIWLWMLGALTGEAIALTGVALALIAFHNPFARYKFVWMAFAILVGFLFISALWAPQPLRPGTPWSALHLFSFPLGLLAWRTLDATGKRWTFKLFQVVAILAALFCLLQHQAYFPELLWDQQWIPTHRIMESSPTGYRMAGGLHFHRLKYSHTLVLLMVATLPYFHRTLKSWKFSAFVALLVLSLLTTYARAGLLALVIGSSVYWALARRSQMRRAVLAGIALVLLLPYALSYLDVPIDRLGAWRTARQLFTQHRWLGVGYGGYTSAALATIKFPDPKHPLLHLDAHSIALQFLAEGGIVAASLVVLAIAVYGRMLKRLSHAQLAVLSAIGTLAVVHNLFFHTVVTTTMALALGLGDNYEDSARA
jgi:O-antigen ligase